MKSRAHAYVHVFDQYDVLSQFEAAELRLNIFKFFADVVISKLLLATVHSDALAFMCACEKFMLKCGKAATDSASLCTQLGHVQRMFLSTGFREYVMRQ